MKILHRILTFIFLSTICYGQVHLGPGQTYSNIQAAFDTGAILPGDTVFLHAGSYSSNWQGVSKLKGNGLLLHATKMMK